MQTIARETVNVYGRIAFAPLGSSVLTALSLSALGHHATLIISVKSNTVTFAVSMGHVVLGCAPVNLVGVALTAL